MAFSSTINVVAAFLVSFTLPYLLNAPYAALGAGVGWIYGGFAVVATLYSFFFVPETKGRALEELDECFAARLSARKFAAYQTTGAAALLHELETGHFKEGLSETEKSHTIASQHIDEPQV